MALRDLLRPANDDTDLEHEAHGLAQQMPALLVEAGRVAHTVTHGIHGRRRRGPGETFWQFRHFEDSDSTALVDWRRSASSDHLFVREREWEAAHTVWLWPDLSPSMRFHSHLCQVPKQSRAIVLALALGELLTRAGERIGLIGHMPVTAHRNAAQRMAETLSRVLADQRNFASLPESDGLRRFSECILLSDFLEPAERVVETIEQMAALGLRGHMVQILDPAEETLPYSGRVLFEDAEQDEHVLTGKAEILREAYQARIQAHRDTLVSRAQHLEWSFMVHHTDRPAEEALLALFSRLGGMDRDYRFANVPGRG